MEIADERTDHYVIYTLMLLIKTYNKSNIWNNYLEANQIQFQVHSVIINLHIL